MKHIHADYYFPDPASVLSVLERLEAEDEGRKWLSWAMELQFIAQAGITTQRTATIWSGLNGSESFQERL